MLLDCPVMPSRFEGAQSFAVAPALGLSLALGFLAGCLKLLLATGWFLARTKRRVGIQADSN